MGESDSPSLSAIPLHPAFFLPCHFFFFLCHFQMGIIHTATSAGVKLRSPDPLASFGIDRSWSGTELCKSQSFNIKTGCGGRETRGTFPVKSEGLLNRLVGFCRVHRRVHSQHCSLMSESEELFLLFFFFFFLSMTNNVATILCTLLHE